MNVIVIYILIEKLSRGPVLTLKIVKHINGMSGTCFLDKSFHILNNIKMIASN